MDRRQALAVIGATALAGCTGALGTPTATPSPTPHQARSGWASSEKETDTRAGSVTLTIEGELAAQEFGAWNLSPSRSVEVEISVDVVGSDEMDVVTMEDDEFDRYRDGKSVSVFSDLSMSGVNEDTVTGTLPEGDYKVVFDNTNQGQARAVEDLQFSAEIVGRNP